MMDVFKWFASLSVLQGILLFVGVLLILGLMPYYGIIYKCIGFWYRKEKGKILDFKFDVALDHYLLTFNGKEYYKLPDDQGFLLNGGRIILTWRVTGAYRVDIDGVGKKLKGNGAYSTVNRKKPNYKMTIYTLQGKKTKILHLPVDKIRDLNTTKLVNQRILTRDLMANTHGFTRSTYTGFSFTQSPPQVSISYPHTSINYPEIARMNYKSPYQGVVRNPELSALLEEQKVVKLNFLNDQKYFVDGKHIFYHVREKMQQEIIDNRE